MRRETFETPGELTLAIKIPTGRIEIESVTGTTTEVELDIRGGDEAAELLDDARIELRGNELVVEVEDRRWSRLWRRLDIRLKIRAPEGANLNVSTASGDLRGQGRFGWLEAEAGDRRFGNDQRRLWRHQARPRRGGGRRQVRVRRRCCRRRRR